MALLNRGVRGASCIGVLSLILAFLSFIQPALCQTQYVTTTNPQGQTVYLPENRQPALYTQNFGDCLGGSLIDISRFDAGYYQDNMTVTFHLQGTTQLTNASVISKYRQAYAQQSTYQVQCTCPSMPMVRIDSASRSIHVMRISSGK
jgi:hypothetical protein